MLTPGLMIREFKVLSKLGEGGMGSVYLAEDTMLDRKIALKVLNPQLTSDPQFIERFRIEAKVQANLSHPNLVSVLSFFVHDNLFIMAMEYAKGKTLKDLIAEQGAISENKALEIMNGVLAGVGFAHQMGIVHRDLKPSNIMIDDYNNVKIMDFGIAKIIGDRQLTKTGTKMGTLYYMSPEQIKGVKDIDQKSDIYSLGVIFYEMLTGKVPINTDTESDYDIMTHIINGVFSDVNLTNNLSKDKFEIIQKMTATSRDNRFSTCYQVLNELGLTNESVATRFNTQKVDNNFSEAEIEKAEITPPITTNSFQTQSKPAYYLEKFKNLNLRAKIGLISASLLFLFILSVIIVSLIPPSLTDKMIDDINKIAKFANSNYKYSYYYDSVVFPDYDYPDELLDTPNATYSVDLKFDRVVRGEKEYSLVIVGRSKPNPRKTAQNQIIIKVVGTNPGLFAKFDIVEIEEVEF